MNFKGVLTSVIFASSLACSQKIGNMIIPKDNPNHSRVGIELEEVVSKQEKAFGIKHFGRPEIFLSFPLLKMGLAASYDPKYDIIYFRVYHKSILAHELGHFYTDKLSEKFDNDGWPNYENYPFSFGKGDKGKKAICEGIANYFELEIQEDTVLTNPTLDEAVFDSCLARTGIDAFYDVGYFLVKPLLDKDVRKGIEYLLKNTPSDEDLNDIFAYRKRISKEFERFLESK